MNLSTVSISRLCDEHLRITKSLLFVRPAARDQIINHAIGHLDGLTVALQYADEERIGELDAIRRTLQLTIDVLDRLRVQLVTPEPGADGGLGSARRPALRAVS